MLRNVIDEIVRRRLWPIPLVALAVVVAVPLLFLKSGPPEAAPDATVVSAAPQADLPARAQQLLTATDAGRTSGRLARSARDPFQAPASRSKAAKKASTKATSSAKKKTATAATAATKGTSDNPVAVVVQNADGSTPSASPAATSAGGGSSTARTTRTSTSAGSPVVPSVDVRFGAHKDSPIQRRIGRMKIFKVHGQIAVVYMRYSTTKHHAIFAIAPTTTVRGEIGCRRVDGACRYVDIPVGSYARLTFTLGDGSRVSRRLDVVRSHDG